MGGWRVGEGRSGRRPQVADKRGSALDHRGAAGPRNCAAVFGGEPLTMRDALVAIISEQARQHHLPWDGGDRDVEGTVHLPWEIVAVV